MDRFEEIVRDMTSHVGEQVHATVKRHGMTMPSAGAAADMGARVAAGLAIDVAMFMGLSAFDEGWTDQQIDEAFDACLAQALEKIDEQREGAKQKVREMVADRRAKAVLS